MSGKRRWYPSGSIGNKAGLWALDTDVAAYHEFRKRQQEHREQPIPERQAVGRSPQPPATPQTEAADPAPHYAPVPASARITEPAPQTTETEPDAIPFTKISTAPPPATPRHTATARPPRRRWWQFWRRPS